MIVTDNQGLEERTIVELIYDFKAVLDQENYEMCQKIKEELERRESVKPIDKELVQAIMGFYNKYTVQDESKNKEYFNELFERYS